MYYKMYYTHYVIYNYSAMEFKIYTKL